MSFYDTFHKTWMTVRWIGESVASLIDEQGNIHTIGIKQLNELTTNVYEKL